jgi:hypothetical protein
MCGASMVLTGMFSLSFAIHHSDELTFFTIFSAALMLMIGICIDLSKYIFWIHRSSPIYLILSVLLGFFSLSASVAFFINQEERDIEEKRIETMTYQSYSKKIATLISLIQTKQEAAEKRLNSRYHEQWNKADKTIEEIEQLSEKLNLLESGRSSVGITDARKNSAVSSFFVSISEVFDIPVKTVTVAAFSLLSVLIEVCSMGIIGINHKTQASKSAEIVAINGREIALSDVSMKKIATLKTSITDKSEKSLSIRVLVKKYSLSYQNTKYALDDLVRDGTVIKIGNKYRYSKSVVPTQS